jgi:sugar phosphate isomerase/epimerase
MKRREFLRTAALSALAAASTSPLSFAQDGQLPERQQRLQGHYRSVSPQSRVPIAVQLYSVRQVAQRDLAGTLGAIAEMGYDGVEFAGYYDHDPKDIRKMLDDTGLKCAGTHTGLAQFRNNFERTVEIHQILDTQYMIVPGGLQRPFETLDGIKAIADEFNQFSERARAANMYIGYHAHGYDARLVDGIAAWERFFDATVQDVVMQMDVGNYLGGGGDPYAMIQKFAGRSKTVHLKEHGQGRPVIGEGDVDWNRVFHLSETVGGAEWYVVEDEVTPESLDRIEKSIVALREMGK